MRVRGAGRHVVADPRPARPGRRWTGGPADATGSAGGPLWRPRAAVGRRHGQRQAQTWAWTGRLHRELARPHRERRRDFGDPPSCRRVGAGERDTPGARDSLPRFQRHAYLERWPRSPRDRGPGAVLVWGSRRSSPAIARGPADYYEVYSAGLPSQDRGPVICTGWGRMFDPLLAGLYWGSRDIWGRHQGRLLSGSCRDKTPGRIERIPRSRCWTQSLFLLPFPILRDGALRHRAADRSEAVHGDDFRFPR